MTTVELPSAIEPTEWFVVFNETSANWWLTLLTPGHFKHVSAFGYCHTIKLWLAYDVQLSGTRITLMDKAAVMAWTKDCTILKIARTGQRMGLRHRICFHCVTAIKHLIGLKCVAATPDGLYRHILNHGGILISDPRRAAPAASRSEPR